MNDELFELLIAIANLLLTAFVCLITAFGLALIIPIAMGWGTAWLH
ncbi:MAG: hypothetical protein AAFY20_18990 [Cyanobacteria bacterium J06639_14]